MSTASTTESPAFDIHSVDTATVALKTFFRIADAWGLTADEQQSLLGVPQSTYAQWREGLILEGLPLLALERISHALNIYVALHTLLPEPELADAWPRRRNSAPLFGGSSALGKMLGTLADLQSVARYLDSCVASGS